MNDTTKIINPIRLGIAVGATGVVFYLGCILHMAITSHERAITFFNSLAHCIDFAPILRHDVPFAEMAFGIVGTFVLGWFAGALIAAFYNLSLAFSRRH